MLGATMTVDDCYLFAIASWLDGVGIDPRRFPQIHEHGERMRSLAFVDRVLAAQ